MGKTETDLYLVNGRMENGLNSKQSIHWSIFAKLKISMIYSSCNFIYSSYSE